MGSSRASRPDGVTLIIADDHPATLEGLSRGLAERCDIDVVASCRDGAAALAAIRELAPDVALLDLSMPRLGGREVIEEVVRLELSTRVIVCSMRCEPARVRDLLTLGACGYLTKTSTVEEVGEAVWRVKQGGVHVAPELREGLHRELSRPRCALSRRERQVLELVAAGLQDKEIAARLFISRETVRTILKRCAAKIGVQGRTALAVTAMSQGLLDG